MTNKDGGYRLPEEIDPQRIQFCIEIPNDLNHIIAFWGALEELTWAKNWEWDGNKTGKDVALVWEDVIKKARASYLAGECASPEICQDYRPTSARLTWFPENPYHPLPIVPDGYTYHPWTIVDNSILGTIIGMWGLGYKVGDVYTDFTKLPAMSSWVDIFENLGNMPSFTIGGLTGTGTVKIHFLNIPQGGRALIQVDDEFDVFNLQLVELNKDLVSVPQETQVPFVVEVPIETDGAHTVKVSFLPTVDDTFIPIFFGGGFRGFELCGFGREGCNCMSGECCDDLNANQVKTNLLLEKILNLIDGGFKIVPLLSTQASDFVVDCSPTAFIGEPEQTPYEELQWFNALCLAVTKWLIATICAQFAHSNKGSLIPQVLALADMTTAPTFMSQLNFADFDMSITSLNEILESDDGFVTAVCAIRDELNGRPNTFVEFKAALQAAYGALVGGEAGAQNAANIGYHYSLDRENYAIFARALDTTHDAVVDGDEENCLCADAEACDPANFEIIGLEGTVVTRLTDTTWRIQQEAYTIDSEHPETRWYTISVREQSWRCIDITGYSEGTAFYDQYSCTGVHQTGVGGGGGHVIQCKMVHGQNEDYHSIDAVMTIVCP